MTLYSPGRVNGNDRSHGVATPLVQLCYEPNLVVLESDVRFSSKSTSNNYVQVLFAHGANNANYGQLNLVVSDGAVYFSDVKVGYVDQWFNLKFELYTVEGKLKLYNNGTFVGEVTTFSQASTSARLVSELKEVSKVQINTYNGNGKFIFSVDNVAAYLTEKAYVEETANELPAASPDTDDFDPSSTPGGGNEGGNQGGNQGGTTDPTDPPVNPPVNPPVDPDPIIPDGGKEDWPEITPPDKDGVDDGDVDEWT